MTLSEDLCRSRVTIVLDPAVDKFDFLAEDAVLIEPLAAIAQKISPQAEKIINSAALKPGNSAPNFTLTSAFGTTVKLTRLLKDGPIVVVFFRGIWCPFCNLYLSNLQSSLAEIRKLGATLIAISPQTPDYALAAIDKNHLTFEVLSDMGNQVARKFGVTISLPPEMADFHESLGIYLSQYNGDDSDELPIPAVFIIRPDGQIATTIFSPDYTIRPKADKIVAAVGEIKRGK